MKVEMSSARTEIVSSTWQLLSISPELLMGFTPPSPVDTFKCSWALPRFYLTHIFTSPASFWFCEVHENSLSTLEEEVWNELLFAFQSCSSRARFCMKCKWWKSGSAQQSQDCGWICQKLGIRNFIPLGKGISMHPKMYFFMTPITAALY